MKSLDEIWEERYKNANSIARYPYEQIISKIFNLSKYKKEGTKAFDFGYGGGNHLWMLEKENIDAWGIDISEEAKKLALETAIKFGVNLNSEQLLVGKLDQIKKIDNESFDFLIDRESLVQLKFSDAKKYVDEFYRILKKDGFIVSLLFSDCHEAINYGNYESNGLYKSFSKGGFSGMGHRQFYSISMIRDLFKEFRICNIQKISTVNILGDEPGNSEYLVTASRK